MYTIEKLIEGNLVLNAGAIYAINMSQKFTEIPEAIYKANLRGIVGYINTSFIKVHLKESKADKITKPVRVSTAPKSDVPKATTAPTPLTTEEFEADDVDITELVEADVDITTVSTPAPKVNAPKVNAPKRRGRPAGKGNKKPKVK